MGVHLLSTWGGSGGWRTHRCWVTTSAATHMVEVRTKFHVVCGDLILADRQQVSIRTKANGTVYVPQMAIENMKPVRVCDTTP
jgi:uncharacterized membrane protein YecN with MAPEG domain